VRFGQELLHKQCQEQCEITGTAKRLHLGRLPDYAPDLNLDEGIWNDLK